MMREPKPLHVLMTVDAVGGVWQYALDLARDLQRRTRRTTLALLGPPPAAHQVAGLRATPGIDLLETGLAPEWLADDASEVMRAGSALSAFAERIGADVIHLNHPALAAKSSFSVPVVATAHSCVATWWNTVRGGAPPEDFSWRASLTGAGYRAADMVIAPSKSFAKATARAHGLAHRPLIIPNGRSLPKNPRRRDLHVGPFVITVGRLWDEGKNVATIERAARRLPFPVLAAGPTEGPNGAAIRLRHVRAVGPVSEGELDLWCRSASVFVSTALYEPFGLSVLEAAQRGCPLVLSDIPTFRELWHGAAAFVPPNDEVALAETVSHIVSHKGYATRLSNAARKRARIYTVESMAYATLDAYRAAQKRHRLSLVQQRVAA